MWLPDLTNLPNSALIWKEKNYFPIKYFSALPSDELEIGACESQHSGCLNRKTKIQGLPELFKDRPEKGKEKSILLLFWATGLSSPAHP